MQQAEELVGGVANSFFFTDIALNNPLMDLIIEYSFKKFIKSPKKQEEAQNTFKSVQEFFSGNFYGTPIFGNPDASIIHYNPVAGKESDLIKFNNKKIQDAYENPHLEKFLSPDEKKILSDALAQGFRSKARLESLKPIEEILKAYPEVLPEETFSEDILNLFSSFNVSPSVSTSIPIR